MRMRYTVAVLAAALTTGIGATHAPRLTSEPVPLAGTVQDPAGQAVQLAHVRVIDELTGDIMTTLTAFNGRFRVQNLASGHSYQVDVRCIGYQPVTLDGITPAGDGSASIDVTMMPIRAHQVAMAR